MNVRATPLSILVVSLPLSACLRPIGFPWLDETTTEGSSTTSEASSETTTGSTAVETSIASMTGSTASQGSDSATSEITDSSTTTETGPANSCGDNILDLSTEECDDGNDDDDDGCNSNCGLDRIIFVTSGKYRGDQINGVDGADNRCRNEAFDGGLVDPLHYRAWISDSQTDARSRIKPGLGRYVRVDGELVAENWTALLSGVLESELFVTQYNEVYQGLVWTGTKPDGTRAVGWDHCGDWTFADLLDPTNGGFYGDSMQVDGKWTLASPEPAPCSLTVPIYCIEEALP